MFSSIIILVVAFLSLIALMVIHEFGHFIIAKKFGIRVDEFGIGYPPRIFGKKIGETIYSINWIPFGAFVRIYGEEGLPGQGGLDNYRSFSNLKIWKRVLIIIGGVVAFWITAIIIFSIVFAMGADLPVGDQDMQGLTNAQVKVISVSANSPASVAGLQSRDTITDIIVGGVDTKINKVADFQKITADNKGKEITLLIKRDSNVLNVSLTPRVNPPAGEGSVGIGLERMATLIKKSAWYMAPVDGAVYTWQTTVDALKGLYITFSGLLGGKGTPEGASFAGPLGITVFLANAASFGAGFFLYFIGMISVFIAIFNLFPIPALDGGKLVFLLIEKIKGKPVSVKVEQWITLVCFTILILLSLFITIKFDIPRFTDFLKSSLLK
ncbi:MAG: M50 family metallopeptidase [Candidatus Staskawiczbacteria bacterium]|nr:M50 family metallopeptidase [Candidatus Staskawiczbacteria bacterium]